MRWSAEDRDSSKNPAGQSAQTETLASLDLTSALPFVVSIFSSIVVAEDPATPSAVSSTDKMRQPKRPPLRSTRPPSDPTTAATQSAHAKPAPALSYLTSPHLTSPHLTRKSPETGITPDPRLPTMARMVSPDAYLYGVGMVRRTRYPAVR